MTMRARLPGESAPRCQTLRIDRRTVLGTLATSLVSCQYAPPPRGDGLSSASWDPPEIAHIPLVILLAIDGVRYQDVFDGPSRAQAVAACREQLVPELMKMEARGIALGAPGTDGFWASGPNYVSLPGYMEMLSGTSATGCTENDCRKMKVSTLLDDFQSLAPDDPTRSGAFSSWPKIAVAASSEESGIVSAGRSSGFGHSTLCRYGSCRIALGRGKSREGGFAHFRYDAVTAELGLAFLKEARPDFAFISLGETDEKAHAGDYVGYLRALKEADAFVGRLAEHLREVERKGRPTLLMVTTDHGRSHSFRDHGRHYPESARSFLFAEGSSVRPQGQLATKASYLRDIAPTIRSVSGLPPRNVRNSGRILREILF